MRASNTLLVCSAILNCAFAHPLSISSSSGPVNAICLELRKVTEGLKRIDSTMKQYTASTLSPNTATETLTLLSIDWELGQVLKNAALEIQKGPKIGSMESVQIFPDVYNFPPLVKTVCDGWIGMKAKFKQAGHQQHLLTQLKGDVDAVWLLSDALNSRLPSVGRYVTNILSKMVSENLNVVIAEYGKP